MRQQITLNPTISQIPHEVLIIRILLLVFQFQMLMRMLACIMALCVLEMIYITYLSLRRAHTSFSPILRNTLTAPHANPTSMLKV